MATVTYKKGCNKKNAAIHNIRKFAKKAKIRDLNELEVALKLGEVYAWETGWMTFHIQETAKNDRIFYITTMYNDTMKDSVNMWSGEDAEWIWELCHKLAKERKCNMMRFETRRPGMARWSRKFGFVNAGYVMELAINPDGTPIIDKLRKDKK